MALAADEEAAFDRDRYGPTPPVRRAQLAEATFGNRDLEQEVLRLFLTQSQTLVCRLGGVEAAPERADLVHTLKGSARAIGADRLAGVCETVEAELRAGEAPAMLTLVSLVEEAQDYIRRVLLA
ncbi:Hpt domain-containing protein [Pannonibacter tanglangensis]|uniref:Hpt domain-containing protein n=1 Tax=Pannonibacter tanglangensis TaxID=2750084 RepID=A0ABW9ZHJ5_9HYPH|nr:Hpt domain-containing protein [Pannonibacter sp. XCT-34]NBN63508.1 Hpt domain-containing protein [Pannonibacter sp. XCT-34]